MAAQQELFEEAKTIFGSESMVTALLQNQGTIANQDDAEKVFKEISDEMKKKRAQLRTYIETAKELRRKFQNACMEGEIY